MWPQLYQADGIYRYTSGFSLAALSRVHPRRAAESAGLPRPDRRHLPARIPVFTVASINTRGSSASASPSRSTFSSGKSHPHRSNHHAPASSLRLHPDALQRPVARGSPRAAQAVREPGDLPLLQEADHDRRGQGAVSLRRNRPPLPRRLRRHRHGERRPLPPGGARRRDAAERDAPAHHHDLSAPAASRSTRRNSPRRCRAI